MKKRFIILLLGIIGLMLMFPNNVKADDKLDAGECMKKYGEISFNSKGKYNSNAFKPKVRYTNGKNNDSRIGVLGAGNDWTNDPVSFTVELKSPKKYKVKKIYYTIKEDDKKSCKGEITDSRIENNEGSVKLNVTISKGTVESVNFGRVSVHMKDSNKKEDTGESPIYIRRRDPQKETNESKKNEEESKKETNSNTTLDEESLEKELFGDDENNNFFCEEDSSLKKFFDNLWKAVGIITPPLLILMCSIDFFKAITSADADKLKKASNNALKRTLAFVILMLLPFILTTVFGWIGLRLCLN